MKRLLLLLMIPTAFLPLCARAQGRAAGPAADLEMRQASAPFRAAAEAFTATARTAPGEALAELIAPSMIAQAGLEQVVAVLDAQVVPFFQHGDDAWNRTTITHTTDAFGHEGFAFYSYVQYRGEARPFVLYVVDEGGRPVVANVLVDHFVAGRHP